MATLRITVNIIPLLSPEFFFLWLNISRLSVNICRFIRLKANFFSRFTTLCKYINDYNNNNDNDDKLKKSLLFGTYIKRFFSIKTKEYSAWGFKKVQLVFWVLIYLVEVVCTEQKPYEAWFYHCKSSESNEGIIYFL